MILDLILFKKFFKVRVVSCQRAACSARRRCSCRTGACTTSPSCQISARLRSIRSHPTTLTFGAYGASASTSAAQHQQPNLQYLPWRPYSNLDRHWSAGLAETRFTSRTASCSRRGSGRSPHGQSSRANSGWWPRRTTSRQRPGCVCSNSVATPLTLRWRRAR